MQVGGTKTSGSPAFFSTSGHAQLGSLPIFLFAPLLLGTCLLAKACLFYLCLFPLQATTDCISVPRCAGNPLHGFRYLVLMTATTVKKSSHSCHKLDVTMLERYVKGALFKVWERGWLLTSFVSEMNQRDFRWMRLKISLNKGVPN